MNTSPALPSWLAPVIVDDLIRLGGPADGGYIVPGSIIAASDCLISLGLGFNWQFEIDFHALHPNAPIYVYDHSRSEAEFQREYREHLASAALGQTPWSAVQRCRQRLESYRALFGQAHVTHVPERVQKRPWMHIHEAEEGSPRTRPDDACIDLIFCRATDHTFLSMDIEGEEWNVFEDVLIHSKRPIGMVVEFHEVEAHWPQFEALMQKALEHYAIVHVHGNNFQPALDTLEVTFGRKDYVSGSEKRTAVPIALDKPNDPNRSEIALVFA
jgi:hypothetical protein